MSASVLSLIPTFTSVSESRKRIFESVFPPNPSASLPTPVSTPVPSFVEQHATPTHGYNTRHHASSSVDLGLAAVNLLPSPSDVIARESRAWHLATTYLSFANTPFPPTMAEWIKTQPQPSKDVVEAIRYLVLSNEDGNVDGRENLVEWYVCEVRRHFLEWVKPGCQIPEHYDEPLVILETILSRATTAQAIYIYRLKTYFLISYGDTSPRKPARRRGRKPRQGEVYDEDPRVRSFVRSLNSIISYSLPDPAWTGLVYAVFLDLCGMAVGLHEHDEDEDGEDESMNASVKGDDDDAIYDKIPQSFETDIDGDIVVTTDEGDPIVPEEMDGMSDFSQFKEGRNPKMAARRKVLQLWNSMEKIGVGGGGRRGERVFAEVINTLITTYIHQSFAEKWESPSSTGRELEYWVENVLGRLIIDVLFSFTVKGEAADARLDKLSPRESLRASRQSLDKRRRGGMDMDDGVGVGAGEEEQKRRREDLESWKTIALGRLGRLRVSELFDIVVDWPSSLGGVEDLKSYITTPQTRLHLITTFTAALNQRILHPAAATSDVINAYIRLIRAFTMLDPRGVLLDRVSRGIRRYIRDREDTVRVIVRGIMADTLPPGAEAEELSELAVELSRGIQEQGAATGGLEEIDFDDLTWVPDPIDAGPEFRRSKGLDVVGSLVSLWESKEVWVKEIQSVLSARLLHDPTYDFTKEVRTVELLKLRFGDPATQACDVMLKDMADSKRADTVISESQGLADDCPEFHAKILSRLFWPTVKNEEFTPPQPIQHIMKKYQRGFEELKKKRKLDWMVSVGTVQLELELEDRLIVVPDATPAQAAVIHAFDSDSAAPVSLSAEELSDTLQMSEQLLKSTLTFWTAKEVLRETSPGVYTVLETLDSRPASPVIDLQQPEEEESQGRDPAEKQFVQQYVVGMLTNSGAMQTARIFTMLGMLMPGGFRWTVEELQEFLTDLKDAGVVHVVAGGWKVV